MAGNKNIKCLLPVLVIFYSLLTNNTSSCQDILLDYYVSATGSDDWDGSSSTHTADSNTGPWATLSHAVSQLRKIRPSSPDSNVNLNLLAGNYFLKETLKLDERDSYITFKSMNSDDDVVISGGILISSTINLDGVHKTVFEGSCGEAFLNDYRLMPARSPNIDENTDVSNNNMATGAWHVIKNLLVETPTCQRETKEYYQDCPEENRHGFIAENSLYSPDWEDVDQTKVLIFHSGIAEFAKVSNITKSGSDWKVMFQEGLKHAPIGEVPQASGWRFLIYNNLGLLDSPGEYVCIEREKKAELSYLPPETEKIGYLKNEDQSLVVSQLDMLILMKSVRHVEMNGLKFQHTSSKGRDGYNFGTQQTIKVVSSNDISFNDCEFSHSGDTALFITDTKRVSISRNVFQDVGYHGLGIMYSEIEEDTRDIMIENNIFAGCGRNNFWQPTCLWVSGSENITIRNNDIGYATYASIRIYGLMPHGPDRDKNNPVFKVEYNDIHDYGLGILNDLGAVYISPSEIKCDLATEEELLKHCSVYSHIFNNKITRGNAFHNGANSLYGDVSSCKTTFENNLMYGPGTNVFYHHCGLDNLSTNNVIHRTITAGNKHDSKEMYESVWATCEKSNTKRAQSFENNRNIYLLDDIEGFHFGRSFDRFYNSSPIFDNNMYWSLAPGDAQSAKLFPDKHTWYEWKESGNDTNSLWEDPLFEDPLNHIYVIKENSPAWSLGINQIDLDHFGVGRILR